MTYIFFMWNSLFNFRCFPSRTHTHEAWNVTSVDHSEWVFQSGSFSRRPRIAIRRIGVAVSSIAESRELLSPVFSHDRATADADLGLSHNNGCWELQLKSASATLLSRELFLMMGYTIRELLRRRIRKLYVTRRMENLSLSIKVILIYRSLMASSYGIIKSIEEIPFVLKRGLHM